MTYRFRKLQFLATYWRANQQISSSGLALGQPITITLSLFLDGSTFSNPGAHFVSKRPAASALALIFLLLPVVVLAQNKGPQEVKLPPDLLLEGGRKLTFERVLTSEKDIRGPKGF